MSKPTALDLFAGAGGLSLGLQRAGWVVDAVEWRTSAAQAHRLNVGPCELADVEGWSPSRDFVLVSGGAPCITYTAAGSGAGIEDPKGKLYEHLLRIAVEAHAQVVLLENTSWLPSMHERALDVILGAFTSCGFSTGWSVLHAEDYGVPQARHRMFIVGFTDPAAAESFEWPQPTHGDGCSKPLVTVRDALGLRGKYATARRLAQATVSKRGWWQGGRCIDVDKSGWTVTTKNNADLLIHADAVARRELERLHATMETGRTQKYADEGYRLCLRELALLQGFPAGFKFVGSEEEKHLQVGNAVPPRLGEVLGAAILAAI